MMEERAELSAAPERAAVLWGSLWDRRLFFVFFFFSSSSLSLKGMCQNHALGGDCQQNCSAIVLQEYLTFYAFYLKMHSFMRFRVWRWRMVLPCVSSTWGYGGFVAKY